MEGRASGYNLTDIIVYNKTGKQLTEDDLMTLHCSQCSELLRDPYQLINCGHRVCKSCLHDVVLKKIPPVCPEDGEAVSENDVRVDKGCAKEIKSLKAVCAGRDYGCPWSGTIDEAEVHVDSCTFIKVSCPQGCGQVLFKGELSSHLEVCPEKPDMSQLMTSLLQKFNQLENSNIKLQVAIGNLQSKVIELEKENSNLKLQLKDVPKLRAQVDEITAELKTVREGAIATDSGRRFTGLDDHGKGLEDPGYGSAHYTRGIPPPSIGSVSSGGTFSSTGSSYTSGYSSGYSSGGDDDVRSIVNLLQKDMNVVKPTLEELSHLKSQLVGYMETVQTVQESVTRHAVAMEEIKLRQDILDVKTTNGVFIWKIPEIARRYSDAQQRRTLSLYSPPFHTSPHGYRMCIRAYLNGDGSGKGTHISVFFVLMKSEHDNLLSWPFKSPVTFQLLNVSSTGSNVTETFMPDLQSPSFQQPKSEMNIASGFPRFAKQAVLKDSNYTKGDAIFIRCKIDLTNIDSKLE